MKFFKKALKMLDVSIVHCSLKYIVFWFFVCLVGWFVLWQVGSLCAAIMEKIILRDVVQARACVYRGGYGYRTVSNNVNYDSTAK